MKNISKTKWADISSGLKLVNETLYSIIDNIDDDLPELILASYLYGDEIIKGGKLNYSGEFFDELNYAHIPICLCLNKDITYAGKSINKTIKTHFIHEKGVLFGIRHFDKEHPELYDHLSLFAGSASVFVDDKFSNFTYYEKLNGHFNIELSQPQSHQDHFAVFKTLCAVDKELQEWQAKAIFFTKEWRDKILNDSKYLILKNYLKECELTRLELISSSLYQIGKNSEWLSHTLKSYQFKPDIYQSEILEQTTLLAKKRALGFRPVLSEESFPIKRMKEILETIYYKKNWVIFLHLDHVTAIDNQPVYLSLGNLYLSLRDETRHKIKSNLSELKHIKYILSRLLSNDLTTLFDNIQLNYYHSGLKAEDDGILNPNQIVNDEAVTRLYQTIHQGFKSSFWRGVIQVSKITS